MNLQRYTKIRISATEFCLSDAPQLHHPSLPCSIPPHSLPSGLGVFCKALLHPSTQPSLRIGRFLQVLVIQLVTENASQKIGGIFCKGLISRYIRKTPNLQNYCPGWVSILYPSGKVRGRGRIPRTGCGSRLPAIWRILRDCGDRVRRPAACPRWREPCSEENGRRRFGRTNIAVRP